MFLSLSLPLCCGLLYHLLVNWQHICILSFSLFKIDHNVWFGHHKMTYTHTFSHTYNVNVVNVDNESYHWISSYIRYSYSGTSRFSLQYCNGCPFFLLLLSCSIDIAIDSNAKYELVLVGYLIRRRWAYWKVSGGSQHNTTQHWFHQERHTTLWLCSSWQYSNNKKTRKKEE